MSGQTKVFTCPKCKETYLGSSPLPDCPYCGYDYREKEGFRWDILLFLVLIFGMMVFFLVSSHYMGVEGALRFLPRKAP